MNASARLKPEQVFGAARLLPQMRLSGNVELSASGKREQVWTYPPCEYDARPFCSGARDPLELFGGSDETESE